ncbi:hypothetical protein SNEBB_001113 [Seison nebaliae]|nr:hypothetical protein SNEBB_001113 [Seison nebaliae]
MLVSLVLLAIFIEYRNYINGRFNVRDMLDLEAQYGPSINKRKRKQWRHRSRGISNPGYSIELRRRINEKKIKLI